MWIEILIGVIVIGVLVNISIILDIISSIFRPEKFPLENRAFSFFVQENQETKTEDIVETSIYLTQVGR